MIFNEISESEIAPFFELIAEVECGLYFDASNPSDISRVSDKIHKRFGAGAKFYAMYTNDATPLGVAGVTIEKPLHSDRCRAELVDIGIFKEHRGKGYGSQLLNHIEDLAKQAHTYALFIVTYAAAYDVIAFYGKNGYAPVAGIPDVNGPGDDGDVLMRKILVSV